MSTPLPRPIASGLPTKWRFASVSKCGAVYPPSEAAADLPLVITATDSPAPVFDGRDLAEGALVCAVGNNWLTRAEIDTHVVRRADNIVCDSVAACRHEAGDFAEALTAGVFDWSRAVDCRT